VARGGQHPVKVFHSGTQREQSGNYDEKGSLVWICTRG
jgi:hypothetical protein